MHSRFELPLSDRCGYGICVQGDDSLRSSRREEAKRSASPQRATGGSKLGGGVERRDPRGRDPRGLGRCDPCGLGRNDAEPLCGERASREPGTHRDGEVDGVWYPAGTAGTLGMPPGGQMLPLFAEPPPPWCELPGWPMPSCAAAEQRRWKLPPGLRNATKTGVGC